MVLAGKGGWPCPFKNATGLPCPGCGLTGAAILLFQGDIPRALRMHAFSPLAVIAIFAVAAAAVLPSRVVGPVADRLGAIDTRFHISAMLLGLLLIYWGGRLSLDF
jgi:hypothetical protein